ncbi:hypothetical protein, partial [Streptomyces sp. NPDC015350]|uniref:hypothetical protein n=1 Tax=Streptomyces sp. NPDC015350 TaxID=3364955 RepID=UPI003702A545
QPDRLRDSVPNNINYAGTSRITRVQDSGSRPEDLIPYTQVNGLGQPTSKVFWRHLSVTGGGRAGHDPIVVVGPVRRWCDFCGPKTPACWSYQVIPVTTRQMIIRGSSAPAAREFTDEPTSSGQLNDTPWYACDGCAGLIEDDQYGALLKRSARVHAEHAGRPMGLDMRVHLHESHQQFRAMKTGERVPINWDR